MGLDMWLGSYKGRNDIGEKLSYEAIIAYHKLYEEMYVHDENKTREENQAATAAKKQEFLELNKITSLETVRGKNFQWKALEHEEIYWRKANQIHNWFVQNVQSGEDDCGMYLVSKEKLQELVDICKEIVDKCTLIKGVVMNGRSSKPNQYCIDNNIEPHMGMYPNYEEGKIMTNQELAEDLLHTRSGFFFGNTNYDQWYYNDVKRTAEEGQELLDSFNFEDNYLVYNSSW